MDIPAFPMEEMFQLLRNTVLLGEKGNKYIKFSLENEIKSSFEVSGCTFFLFLCFVLPMFHADHSGSDRNILFQFIKGFLMFIL